MLKLTSEKYKKIKDRLYSVIFILVFVILMLVLFRSTPGDEIGSPDYNSEELTNNVDIVEVSRTRTEAALDELEMCIEEFGEPIEVVWEGEIEGSMSSGACYAIRKIPAEDNYPDDIPKFMACLSGTDYTGVFYKGKVKITGKWTGMTNMYANAFFDSACVPDVDVEELESEIFPTIINRPERFTSETAEKIKDIIPEEAFLRDYITLNDIEGYLVLYVLYPKLGPELGSWDWPFSSCPVSYYGQVIKGEYWLALVQDWTIVNKIPILFPDWDNWPSDPVPGKTYRGVPINDSRGVWKEGGGLMFRQMRGTLEDWDIEKLKNPDLEEEGSEIIESRQLVLEDLTGDDIANEIRFKIDYISCGNNYYTIVGYDADTNKVMTYKINDGEYSYIGYDNFSPNIEGFVIHDTGCDHGKSMYDVTQFQFDPQSKEYIKISSTGFQDCGAYNSEE